MKTKLLLTCKDFKPSHSNWKVDGIFNPAAIRLPNKKILLMVRVAEANFKESEYSYPLIVTKNKYDAEENLENKGILKDSLSKKHYFIYGKRMLPNISHFRKVLLDKNGFEIEKINERPDFLGRSVTSEYGVEDARIVKMGDRYLMTYVSVSDDTGVSSSLAISKDLKNWKRKGIIFQEQNKDVVLFPEKINGKFVALNRPESGFIFSRPATWISYSKNLIYWGKEFKILKTRRKSWDSNRLGAGPTPIKTEKGWLVIYHGVSFKEEKSVYSAGVALFDLNNPAKLIARSPRDKPLISPTKSYEKKGFMNNVVFPTGAIPTLDGKDLLIYSGGADSAISVRQISFEKIFKSMEYY